MPLNTVCKQSNHNGYAAFCLPSQQAMAIMSNYTNLLPLPFPVPIGAKIVPFMASVCYIIVSVTYLALENPITIRKILKIWWFPSWSTSIIFSFQSTCA